MMRAIVKLAALALGAFVAWGTTVDAQTADRPLRLKGQSSHPASANFHLIFKLWAENVEKMTGGRVKIEALPAGAIVPAFEVFDATSRGEIGRAHV